MKSPLSPTAAIIGAVLCLTPSLGLSQTAPTAPAVKAEAKPAAKPVTEAITKASPLTQTGQAALHAWLIPSYQDLATKARAFAEASQAACAASKASQAGADALRVQKAQKSLSQLQLSWAAVSMITFGPIAKERRLYRLYFWPDKHGTGARQFRKMMAGGDTSRLAPEQFKLQSAALQGLVAAERLLFPATGAPDMSAFGCQLLKAIAHNVHEISAAVRLGWNNAKTPELFQELLKSTINEAQLSATTRIGKVLGESPAKAKPQKAEAHRQQLSLAIIKASLDSSRRLLLGSKDSGYQGLIAGISSSPKVVAHMRSNLNLRFDQAATVLTAIKGPLPKAVANDRDTVKILQMALNDLADYLKFQVAPKAGIEFTFNTLDGD